MGDYEGRRNRRKRATRQAQAIRIKACVDLVNFLRSASSMGDSSPIRCRRKGQRLVVDSNGDQIEQSLEVLCQKLNDDRRGTLCSRLQTSYKLVQESESKRDMRRRRTGLACSWSRTLISGNSAGRSANSAIW